MSAFPAAAAQLMGLPPALPIHQTGAVVFLCKEAATTGTSSATVVNSLLAARSVAGRTASRAGGVERAQVS